MLKNFIRRYHENDAILKKEVLRTSERNQKPQTNWFAVTFWIGTAIAATLLYFFIQHK